MKTREQIAEMIKEANKLPRLPDEEVKRIMDELNLKIIVQQRNDTKATIH